MQSMFIAPLIISAGPFSSGAPCTPQQMNSLSQTVEVSSAASPAYVASVADGNQQGTRRGVGFPENEDLILIRAPKLLLENYIQG